jgi:DNA-binding NarL/FixJ family response regulator
VEARTALDESIELTSSSDVEARVRLIVACAEIEQLLGHHNESQARLRRAYDELHDPGSSAGVSLLIALAASCLFLADHEGMLVWGQSAVEAAAAETDSALSAAALAAYTMGATFAGRIGLALELHERASRAVDSLSDDELTPRLDALSNLTTAELYLDCLAEACTHGERGLSLARATGQTHLVPTLTPILGMALSMVGHMDRSAEVLDDAIEAARLVNNAQAVAMNLFNRSLSASMVGDLETALMLGAESVELARSVDDGVVSAFAGAIHAEALFEAGEPDIALKVLLESAGGAEIPLLAGSWRATFVELLTRCHVALHEESQARAAAGLARELASELGMGLPGLMADRAEAAVALSEGRADDAARLALSSVMHAEKIGARVHAARSRALAGDALAALGRDDEAIAQLELAAGEFEALGALRYRDQVEARLRQLGRTIHRRSRPGKRDGNDLETLTGRELEVAGLVFDRRTNREIAEELFLSVKTVETHIRNIFNKLGATSRVEVARALARSHPAPTTDR